MRTTAITALLAVGVLAAAGTDCIDEALPGESPFTKAPTIASFALLAAAAPNIIGGSVSNTPVTATANSGPALIGVTFAFNVVGGGAASGGPATQNGADGAAAPNIIGGSVDGGVDNAPVTATANSGLALIGVTFAFNTVGGGAATQNAGNGANGAAAPNIIGGSVSNTPVTATANSGLALIGVTFAFNVVGGGAASGGAATQNGAGAAAPNIIGGSVSNTPVTATANGGPALIGVNFAFNTVGGGAATQNAGNGADGAGQAGASPAATAVADPPSRLSATRRPFSAAPAAEADLRGATVALAAQAAQTALRNQRMQTPAPALAPAQVGRRQRPAVTAVPQGSWATAAAAALAAAPSRTVTRNFFSPGGNVGNATSGNGNHQRPGEGGAGGNGGSH